MLVAILTLLAGAAAGQTPAGTVAFSAPWTSPYHVDPAYPHHLVNREGRHLFILNKTAWAFFGCKDPKGALERARAQGVTVIRVALEGTPYFEQLGIDMWPWGGTRSKPDWATFNRAYWEEVERRTLMAGEHGIGLNVTIYMALHPEAPEIATQRAYWDQTIRRLGRYANVLTWEMANEYTRNEAFQDAAGTYFRQHDPQRRPVCSSDGTTDDALWPNKTWMDLAIVHTCTGSQYDLSAWYLAVARNTRSHGKPAFNNETGREKRHRNDDGVHRRKQGWLWNASGAFWTWHSWEGCEGIDDAAYRGPGSEFNKPMSDYFQTLPFWRMAPNSTAFTVESPSLVQAAIADPGRSIVAAYLCTRASGQAEPASRARLRLPNGVYRVTFIDPRDLRASAPLQVETAGIGRVAEIAVPGFTDDLMVKIERIAERRRTVVEGTK